MAQPINSGKDVTAMAYNPYSDQKNRAYQSILTTLFPEQTKTLPRIILWSIVFLADLVLGIGGAAYYGLLQFDRYRTSNELMLVGGINWGWVIGAITAAGGLLYVVLFVIGYALFCKADKLNKERA